MENLIKNVESFRMHVRNRLILSSVIGLLFLISSAPVFFDDSFSLGEKLVHSYFFAIILFILYYIYKNRTNLPLPKEITHESLTDYQIKQLKRYLKSATSMLWWAYLPISSIIIGKISLELTFTNRSIVSTLGILTFLVVAYILNKRWIKRYIKQYEQLTDSSFELWYSL